LIARVLFMFLASR